MNKLLVLGLIVFPSLAFSAPLDTKNLGSEVLVMSRTMDRLMAQQEMKSALPNSLMNQMVHLAMNGESKISAEQESIDKKVALITNSDDMKDCQISFTEKKSPDGKETNGLIEYKGPKCPIALTAKVHVLTSATGAGGDINLQITIVSDKLKQEIDIEKLAMPIKVKIAGGPKDGGYAVDMDMSMGAQIVSQKLGEVTYSGDFKTVMIYGQTISLKVDSTEAYVGAGQKIKFSEKDESENNEMKSTYFINDASVTAEVYKEAHASISVPGFDNQPSPLTQPEVCNVVTYDKTKYNLATVRKGIVDNTVDSLPTSEAMQFPVMLTQTGSVKMPFEIQGQQIEVDVEVSQDAARFSFDKVDGAKPQNLARLTAVLGDKVDLTQVLLNRVVRVTCNLQQ
jgi:hypothetical protein